MNPNAMPMDAPRENSRQRSLFFRSPRRARRNAAFPSSALGLPASAASAGVSASARAMAPCALTGAIGNGSFSTSEVSRKKKYPIVYLLITPMTDMKTIRPMGISQSW